MERILGSLFILSCILLGGCKERNPLVSQRECNGHAVTVFDIPESQDEGKVMKLSELVGKAEIVRLETSGEALIGENADYYVGDSCILVFQDDRISLFNRQGKFIRVIAVHGRGPEEFYRVMDFDVDEKNGYLYVIDVQGDSGVKCWHLKDSCNFRKIETLVKGKHAGVACLENGNLLLVPWPHDQIKYVYYQQTPDGQLGENAPCHSSRQGLYMGSNKLMYSLGDSYRYKSSGLNFSDDTVFSITSRGLIPVWLFNCSEFTNYRLFGETPRRLFLKVCYVREKETRQVNGGVSEYIGSFCYDYCYEKETGDLLKLHSDIQDDLFSGDSWPFFRVQIQNGRKMFIAYPALILLEMAKKGDRVERPALWKEGIANLKEDDNPVLFIGELK